VKIEAKPIAAYTVIANGPELRFTNTSLRAKEIVWDFGDGTSSTENNPKHTFKQKGVYIVQLTVRNECGSSTYKRGISLDFVASNDAQDLTAINVYPNPSTGLFTIDFTQSIPDAFQISVRNVLGQEVFKKQITAKDKGTEETIDISGSPKGNYILELRTSKKSSFAKLQLE
jgi:PKD repeat protein